MNLKKILFVFLVVLVIFSTVGAASAGWFDFLDSKKDSQITMEPFYSKSHDSYGMAFYVGLVKGQNNVENFSLNNATFHVNITDQNGHMETYNYTLHELGGIINIENLTNQNYTVSAYFSGDDKFKSSNATFNITTKDFDLMREKALNKTESSSSNSQKSTSSSNDNSFVFQDSHGNKVKLDSSGKVKN